MFILRQERRAVRWLRTARFVAIAAAALVCAGCWDEVQYEAPPPAEPPPVAPAGVTTEPAAEPDAAMRPATAPPTQAAATPEPTASELFGDEPEDSQVAITTARLPPALDPVADDPVADDSVVDNPVADEAAADDPEATKLVGDDPPPVVEPPPLDLITPQERLDAWTAASGWSLAAAFRAKGLNPDRYGNFIADAERAAAALGVDLPAPPTAAEGDNGEAGTIAALPTGAGVELVAAIAAFTDDAAGAAAQLALDSHRLLLVYTPQSADGPALAAAIRSAGEQSRLPAKLWQPLAELLQRRADFKSVRGAVFALHNAVAKHLAAQALPAPPLARDGSGG